MGQDPTTRSRTQDRNNNGDQENAERSTIPSGVGRRLGGNTQPPPWISRHGDSPHKPRKQRPAERKLKTRSYHSDNSLQHRVRGSQSAQLILRHLIAASLLCTKLGRSRTFRASGNFVIRCDLFMRFLSGDFTCSFLWLIESLSKKRRPTEWPIERRSVK